jgi:hypothetical protein
MFGGECSAPKPNIFNFEKSASVSIEKKDGWVPQSFSKLRIAERYLTTAEKRSAIPRFSSAESLH